MNRTSQPHGDQGGAGRAQGRRQRLAAAAASDRAARDARLSALVTHYRVAYAQAVAAGQQLPADFSGFRGGRLVASISSRPAAPEISVEPFNLACRTLAALDVDSVALLAGDNLALAVTASEDRPSDLLPFIIGLSFGPPGVEPTGMLVPYQLDRPGGTLTWSAPREVRASNTKGLWAEVLAPSCLHRAVTGGEATLAELLELNWRVHNQVLQL